MGTRSHFVSRTPVRVTMDGADPDDPATEYISIRPGLSIGEKTALEAALVDVRAPQGKTEVEVSTDIQRFLNLQLSTFIVGWRLFAEDGSEIPFSVDAIKDFDPDDPLVVQVIAEVSARSPFVKRK